MTLQLSSSKPLDISKSDFKELEPQLHTQLLDAQRACLDSGHSVIVLISGVEAAGKSQAVNRLGSWLDMRQVRTFSYWRRTDEQRRHPDGWRFWLDLPGRGEMNILFGSWYTRLLMTASSEDAFDYDDNLTAEASEKLRGHCQRINDFESLLVDSGLILVKLWFYVSEETQRRLVQKKREAGHYINPHEDRNARYYRQFIDVAEQVLTATDTDVAGWQIINSENELGRDLMAGQALLGYLSGEQNNRTSDPKPPPASGKSCLAAVDLGRSLSSRDYKSSLRELQEEIGELHWQCWERKMSTVIVLEGWDAAGKGGAVRRLTAPMDARLYRVIPVGAPTDEELSHHYLWRFWRQLPEDGFTTIYDRSWYGRVLVERVENIVSPDLWQRAYAEINQFEQQLMDHGICVIKFWLHISEAEQLDRFQKRLSTPHKRYKIGRDDWRNRELRSHYTQAAEDMFEQTSSSGAPWYLVAAEDKRFARVEILRTVCERMRASLQIR